MVAAVNLTALIITLHVWLIFPVVWMTQANNDTHRGEKKLR